MPFIIISDRGTCIIVHKMKLVLSGLHPYFSTYSPFLSIAMFQRVSLVRKILLTVLWATLSLQFSFPRHWHNVCLLNPLSCGRGKDNLMSMEGAVNLSSQRGDNLPSPDACMLSSIVIQMEDHIDYQDFAPSDYYLFGPMKKVLKSDTLCQWRRSENCCGEVAQRTVNRFLRSSDTCSHSKVEHYY